MAFSALVTVYPLSCWDILMTPGWMWRNIYICVCHITPTCEERIWYSFTEHLHIPFFTYTVQQTDVCFQGQGHLLSSNIVWSYFPRFCSKKKKMAGQEVNICLPQNIVWFIYVLTRHELIREN